MSNDLDKEIYDLPCVVCHMPSTICMFLDGEPAFGWCSKEHHDQTRNENPCNCYRVKR